MGLANRDCVMRRGYSVAWMGGSGGKIPWTAAVLTVDIIPWLADWTVPVFDAQSPFVSTPSELFLFPSITEQPTVRSHRQTPRQERREGYTSACT